MNRLVGLGGASFAATTLLVLIGAISQEVAHGAALLPSTPAPVAQPVVAAVSMSLLQPAARGAVQEAAPAPTKDAPGLAFEPYFYAELDLPAEPELRPWGPPTWFPEEARDDLWAIDGIGDGTLTQPQVGPKLGLSSRSVFVYDIESGEVLLSLNADDPRPVASLTKLVAALAMASEQPDLDVERCLDISFKPSWPGAGTKLRSGSCATGWDLLGAALVRSDNGAAAALAQVADLPVGLFVDRMNTVSDDLGMTLSHFSDPSGAEDDNLSTARDMTRAVLAASRHPSLSAAASAPFWDLHDTGRERTRRLFTTNRLHDRGQTEVLAAKTGYTDTARYCFTGVFRTRNGREVAITTLGARWSRQRWSDMRTLLGWVERLD